MNTIIASLLSPSNSTAAEMTHNLSLLGYGDMSAGIQRLWLDGYITGVLAIATIGCCGYIVGHRVTHKQRQQKKVELIGTAFNAGFEVGKRQEQDFRKYAEEEENKSFSI